MASRDRDDPYLDFRFQIEIDSLIVAGCSEISGLELELETEEYEEGGVNTYTHTLPKRFGYPNIELRRGLTNSETFYNWIQEAVNGQVIRKNGRVFLLDSTGKTSWGWEFQEAYPVRWAGPDLTADDASVAFETLELAHNGLSKMEGLPSE